MIFADSYYLIGLLNDRDPAHEDVVSYASTATARIMTSELILVEVANALADTGFRKRFIDFAKTIEDSKWLDVIWSSRKLIDEGLELYSRRPDKQWSLTDCTSFIIMKQFGITDALTHDHHFKQAGFRVLL